MKDYHKRKVGSFRELADGTIEVAVTSGTRRDGQRRRVTAKAANREDAERVALELASELGRRPDLGHGLTLKRWWDAYGAGKGKRIANSTFKRYEGSMERVWLPKMGDSDISLISKQDVQAALLSLPSRSEAQHAKSALSAVLTQAVRDGYLSKNPIRSASFELPGDVGVADESELDWTDPFAAIEKTSDVWGVGTVLKVMPKLRDVPIETVFLCMVGGGLRRQEALALLWKDVRRIKIDGHEVTQLAVYKAKTVDDGLKQTKTKRSVRIVTMLEPFGARLWELRESPQSTVARVSVGNINKRWKCLFEPVTSKHAKTEGRNKGKLCDKTIKYIPLMKLRNTHESLMQEAGVLDSINAAMHGHSQKVSYKHYQRGDTAAAAVQASSFVLFDGGLPKAASE